MDNEAQILLDDIISFCQRDGLDTRLINMLGRIRPRVAGRRVSHSDRFQAGLHQPTCSSSRRRLERHLEEVCLCTDGTQSRGPRDARAGTSTAAGAPGVCPSSIFTSGSTRRPNRRTYLQNQLKTAASQRKRARFPIYRCRIGPTETQSPQASKSTTR